MLSLHATLSSGNSTSRSTFSILPIWVGCTITCRISRNCFPIGDSAFQNEWHQYCLVENTIIDSSKALATFWARHGGDLAKLAYFLIHVPTTSAGVERSFGLAGNMGTKYR